MIDRLKRLAEAAERLAAPSLAVALSCFVYATFVIFTSTSVEDDKYLFPSILGFVWMLSFYGFVGTFGDVPQRSQANLGFVGRVKYKLSRFWYWTIGGVFLASTAAVAVFTFRVLSVWLSSYAD